MGDMLESKTEYLLFIKNDDDIDVTYYIFKNNDNVFKSKEKKLDEFEYQLFDICDFYEKFETNTSTVNSNSYESDGYEINKKIIINKIHNIDFSKINKYNNKDIDIYLKKKKSKFYS